MDVLSLVKAGPGAPVNYTQSIASLNNHQLDIWCHCRNLNHLGIVGIVSALMGTVYILRFKRKESVWILLTSFALLLSFGFVWYVNGRPLYIYWTPYRLLQDNLIFRALWHPYRMIQVLIFPVSILIAYGWHSRLRAIRLWNSARILMMLSLLMLLYGTSIAPIYLSPGLASAYLSALQMLPEGAIIDLPMGRHPAKFYMAMQRFHRRPLAEGMIPITPKAAYDYIKKNDLLDDLRSKKNNYSAGITDED